MMLASTYTSASPKRVTRLTSWLLRRAPAMRDAAAVDAGGLFRVAVRGVATTAFAGGPFGDAGSGADFHAFCLAVGQVIGHLAAECVRAEGEGEKSSWNSDTDSVATGHPIKAPYGCRTGDGWRGGVASEVHRDVGVLEESIEDDDADRGEEHADSEL